MKICLTGPHGSGKTTLLERIREQSTINTTFITEITRELQKKGFRINEAGGDETQLLIIGTHLENLFTQDSFITDRCLLDGLVYTTYLWEQKEVSDWVFEFAYRSCRRYIKEYDFIFYIPAEFHIEDDGVRSVNNIFHTRICQLFDFYIKHFNLEFIKLSGSIIERFNQFEETLEA